MKMKWKKAGLFGLAVSLAFTASVCFLGKKTVYAADEVVEITEKNFPDSSLRNYVDGYDSDGNGWLSTEEIKRITYVDLSGNGVTDLKGFEYLTSATGLNIKGHTIEELDLSEYTWLKYVTCDSTDITFTLDVSGCKDLVTLYCWRYDATVGLTEITLGDHPDLDTLACYNTQISSIDLSGCPNLTTLPIYSNPNLTSLDVSACTALKFLYCYENSSLTDLTLGTHPNLDQLICYDTKITKLALSGCPDLQQVVCYGSNISEITLGTHEKLTQLIAHENQFEEIDLSGCPNLKTLTVFTNELTSLDVSACTNLETLNCHDNNLTALDISNCPNLKSISCHWNRMPSLDLSSNTAGFSSLTTVYQDRGQEINGVLYKTEDGYYIDLADGLIDKTKVTDVEKGTYDEVTGRIYLDDPMEIGDTITYSYDTGGTMLQGVSGGTPIMVVEVTITAIKDLTIPDEPTTTEDPTTEEPTTTEAPTTEEPTVTEDPTTEEPTTTEAPTTEEPTTEEPSVTDAPTTEDNTAAPADVTTPTTDETPDAETTPSTPAAKTGDEAMPMAALMICLISAGGIMIVRKKKSE